MYLIEIWVVIVLPQENRKKLLLLILRIFVVLETIRYLLDSHVTIAFCFFFYKQGIYLSVMVHASHSSTRKVEAVISGVQDQYQLLRDLKASVH